MVLDRRERLHVRMAQLAALADAHVSVDRAYLVLTPIDFKYLGEHGLARHTANAAGAAVFIPRLPPQPFTAFVDNSRLAFTAWARMGLHLESPQFRMRHLSRHVFPQLKSDIDHMFASLDRVLREREFPITVVPLPMRPEVLAGRRFAIDDAVFEAVHLCGLDIVDLWPEFLGSSAKPDLYIADGHYSELGDDLVLAALERHHHRDRAGRAGLQAWRGAAMNFTEKAFLPFVLVVFLLWAACRTRENWRLGVLFSASLFAYGFHKWPLLVLLLTYCVVNWAIALWLTASARSERVLALGVALNLLGLAFWKYVPMAVQSLLDLAFAFDVSLDLAVPHWILPWGISFYTFTCIAYLTDVYRGDHAAERSLPRFTLFIAFFPHLVAGPILRGKEFLDALRPGTPQSATRAARSCFALGPRGIQETRPRRPHRAGH